MSNSGKTPYEIRLELLKMSKDLLMEEFYAHRDIEERNWTARMDDYHYYREHGAEVERAKYPFPKDLVIPKAPTEAEIIARARTLNEFIGGDGKNVPKDENVTRDENRDAGRGRGGQGRGGQGSCGQGRWRNPR